jgi:branched-chain amino acid transport system permease protein
MKFKANRLVACIHSAQAAHLFFGAGMKAFDLDYSPLLVPCWRWHCRWSARPTWLTLTVAGLAMGMIIFIIASGLTLVFGLMDVLNFGHGVFIALGAFVATSVLGAMGDWTGSPELWRNLVAVLPAMLVAMLVAGAVGWPSSASSCARCTASTSSRSSSPWAA